MSGLRRFLVLLAWMFWQGGFTFYSAIVVPIGTKILGGPLEQGFITRQVTVDMNLAGVVALCALAWDGLATRDSSRWRYWVRCFLLIMLALGQTALFWLHGPLDGMLDLETGSVDDHRTFRTLHRVYLWISTAQWGAGLAVLWLMLAAWRSEDRSWRLGS